MALTQHTLHSSSVDKSVLLLQVWPKYLDICFFITYGVTLILSYTIPASFVQRSSIHSPLYLWQVIIQGGVFLLITVSLPPYRCMPPEAVDALLPVYRCLCQNAHVTVVRLRSSLAWLLQYHLMTLATKGMKVSDR